MFRETFTFFISKKTDISIDLIYIISFAFINILFDLNIIKPIETNAPNNSAKLVENHKACSLNIKGNSINDNDKNTNVLNVDIISEVIPSPIAVKKLEAKIETPINNNENEKYL